MAAPLLAGDLEPARERPLADPVDSRDLGLAALAGLVGRERPLAQVGGVGTRHRSPPVGVEAIPTADRDAGSVDGRAIRSSTTAGVHGSRSGVASGSGGRAAGGGVASAPSRARPRDRALVPSPAAISAAAPPAR